MYIGPEVLMPLASIVAGVVGFALLFWRKTVALARGIQAGVGRLFRGDA